MQQIQRTALLLHKLIGASLLLGIVASPTAIASQVSEGAIANHFIAQSALQPSSIPLDLGMMQQGLCASETPGITIKSVSQTDLTIPSFWWTRDQIAAQSQFGSKLLENWLACLGQGSTPNRADFVVNQQVWSLLDYLERYRFVQELGTATSDYGYNLRVFNRQGTLLAAYTCNFEGAKVASGRAGDPEIKAAQNSKLGAANSPTAKTQNSAPSESLICALGLDSTGKAGFRGRGTNGLDGVFPTGGGTARP